MVSLSHACRAIASAILPGNDEEAKPSDAESQISLLRGMLDERVDYSIAVARDKSGTEQKGRCAKNDEAFVSTRQPSRDDYEYSNSASCLLSSLAVSRIISSDEKQYHILQNCLVAFLEYVGERISWDGSLFMLGNAFILMDICLTRAQNSPDFHMATHILRDNVMYCENIKSILKTCFSRGMFRKGAVARTVGGIYNKWRVAPSAPSFEEAILPSKAAEENGSHLSQDDADYREDKTSNLIRDLNEYEHCASQLHESYEWLTSQGSGLRKDPTQAEVFYDILFKSFVLDSAISRKMESEESAPKNQEELPSNTLSHASKYVNSKESFNQILSILGSLGSDDILFSLWCDKSAEGRLSREILGEVRGFLDSEGALLHKASDYKALVESSSKVQAYKAIQQELSAQVQQLNHDMVLCLEEKENMRGRWKYELDERRRLNEQLQELKGNIRVYCRIRGKRQAESEPGDLALIKAYDDTSSEEVVTLSFTQLNSPHASEKKKKAEYKSFPFDRVYDASSTQKDVYGDTSELVASVMDGSNVCIFAYGQTGSGKTHTMLGSQDSPGIVLNALRDLFSLKSKREGVKSYTIQLSIKEIYQEQVRDLLSGDDCNNSSSLAIRIDPESNLPITPDQICLQVESMEQCHSSILKAMESRKTSSTLLNERSSRSHLIVSVLVQGKDLESKAHFASKLNLVDLAGSERLDKSKAQGLQKKEAIKINCSLSALSDVLMALKRKKDHVPYRNSKLTHLLQDSLGQGSKTLMLTTLAPTKACIHESLSSVRFAMKVKEVELAPNQSKKGERRPR